jgi:Peptidase family M28
MRPVSASSIQATLHEVVETLAPLDRRPCSSGERAAADWLQERLRTIPGADVQLEQEPSWGTFPPTCAVLGMLGVAGAALVLAARPRIGVLLAALSFAGVVDEAQNGPRLIRRALRRRRSTVNVIARTGRQEPPPQAGRTDTDTDRTDTLVILAHHDAPQTGFMFDQTLPRKLHALAPTLIDRMKTSPPQWWIGLAGPLCTVASAISRRRGPARAAIATGVLGCAIVIDVWRSRTVAGANDNLSGVAALVALAELLRERPVPGLRVLLVSCGAEETLQDGVRAFIARHRHELAPGRTCFVNLDSVGSPHLAMLEGEGPVWMEDYSGPWLRELIAQRAQALGIPLERGFRARASTDSVIPSRAGYPIATLVSITDWRTIANYHLPSDIPANLDYATVARATRLVYDVAHALADRAPALAGEAPEPASGAPTS